MGSVGSASLQVNVLEELEGSAPSLCQKGTLTGTACPTWSGAPQIPCDRANAGTAQPQIRDPQTLLLTQISPR